MLRGLKAGLEEHVEQVTSGVHRLDLGLKMLRDNAPHGMAPGQLMLVVARSGVGKTSIGLNAVRAHPDLPTLFLSMEMPFADLSVRLVSMVTGRSRDYLEGELHAGRTPGEYTETWENFPLFLCEDKAGLSIKDLKEAVEVASGQVGNPALVVVDYLELVRSMGIDQGAAVNKIAQACKELAKHFNTRVLLLHQANRHDGGSGNQPLTTNAARFGGDMAADYMMTAWRPNQQQHPDEVYLAMPKNRHGPPIMNGIRHRLDGPTGRLSEWNEPTWLTPVTDDEEWDDWQEA